MSSVRTRLDVRRLARLIQAALQRCRLDLSGAVILTEAAAGPYVVTPVLAAAAGAARVYALTRPTRHGSVEDVMSQTAELADYLGVRPRLEIITRLDPEVVARAEIITNSGHVRPLDAALVDQMNPMAVISLMYETWELRAGDVDVAACRRHGIWLAGTNERHPAVDVFAYLGLLAVKLLLDAGIAVYRSAIVCLCDNPFTEFLHRGLEAAGARVSTYARMADVPPSPECDAILVALRPRSEAVLTANDLRALGSAGEGLVIAQFWGDVDRDALAAAGFMVWPPTAPLPGHMGILLSEMGPEPIIRLQTGGLRAGEVLWRSRRLGLSMDSPAFAELNEGFAEPLLLERG